MNILCKTALVALTAIMASGCTHKKEATVPEDIRVKTIKVTTSSIDSSRGYSGTLEESSGTTLSFAVPGTIRSIGVNVGDRVSKGQLVGTLETSTLENSYQISKTALDQAQDTYRRMKMLYDANSLAEAKWVEVQNALKTAQSSEAIAKKALSDARLVAPQGGYVAQKYMDPGMNALPGVPVVKIVALNPIKVSISIPENEIQNITEGQTATITVGALDGKTFSGKVTDKGVVANAITRSYDVKITVDNPEQQLLPGMICDVTLGEASAQTVIQLPASAVLLDANNQNFVWLDVDGHATKRIVSVKGMTDNGIIISSGLNPSDQVIVEGQQKVSENTKVTAIE